MTAWRQRRPGRLDTHKLYSVYGYSLQLRAARDGDPVRASKVVANAVYGKRGESMIIGPFREYSRKNTQPAFIQEMRDWSGGLSDQSCIEFDRTRMIAQRRVEFSVSHRSRAYAGNRETWELSFRLESAMHERGGIQNNTEYNIRSRIIGIVNTNGQNVGTSVLDGVAMRHAD
ncbi:hypothetical protein PCH_Pc22g17850 [Penicillium rubens Wisconsin 54-1255]|uniref:Uncharacterized protein n=1 Tax=Penicillium rubens (strain ATCC 28089 / DSM 1075 / NRRL 1951 / Wisconsin 54-1255) TaxID=500485 RepID=B6HTN8_PENRW|nr:hypothetical protein PCH_Pc22g17850 [Penicillium rubens Wisconsin 54-1255]